MAIVGFVVSLCIFTSKKRRKQIQEGAHQLNLALKDKVGRLRTSFRRGTRRGSGGMGEDTNEGLEMGVRNPLDDASISVMHSNSLGKSGGSVRTKENHGVSM